MVDFRARAFRLATGINSAGNHQVLKTVSMEGIALAVWQKQLPDGLDDWLDQLPSTRLPTLDSLVVPDAVGKAVLAAALAAGSPGRPETHRLAADVAHLARLLLEIAPGSLLRVRLEVQANWTPATFDLPLGRARLVCCYRGHGLQVGAAGKEGPPSELLHVPNSSVALFRGLLWPAREPAGLMYRSAPGDKESPAPFVLTIEPADDTAGQC